jgi:hypothetical protein
MTLEDLPPNLSLIADRYLARAKAELEELGIDTDGMLPAEIFDQVRDVRLKGVAPQAPEPGERRQLRRSRERIEVRGHRAWRHDWRRKSGLRQRIGKRIPRQD